MPGQATVQTTIRLPLDLAQWLEDEAARLGMSKVKFLVVLIAEAKKEQGE